MLSAPDTIMDTIVITPGMVPGRVVIRRYKKGIMKGAQMANMTGEDITDRLYDMLLEMGLPVADEDTLP